MLTSIGTVECTPLYLGPKVLSISTPPLSIHFEASYTKCTLGGSSCTVTEENGPGELKLLKEGHETASATGEFLIHVACGALLDCSYNGTGLRGTAKGPLLSTQANGELSFVEQALTKEVGGFICPKSAKLDLTTTPLTASYITS